MKQTLIASFGLVVAALALCSCETPMMGYQVQGNGILVNISANNPTPENPVNVALPAGRYTIQEIGIANGGAYDGWKAWMYAPRQDSQGQWVIGWLNRYNLSSDALGEMTVNDNTVYGSAAAALSAAIPTSLNIESAATVRFYIKDSPAFDNQGGISLLIIPQP